MGLAMNKCKIGKTLRRGSDGVVIGTPIDLGRFIKIKQPATRVYYELSEIGKPDVKDIINEFVKKH